MKISGSQMDKKPKNQKTEEMACKSAEVISAATKA